MIYYNARHNLIGLLLECYSLKLLEITYDGYGVMVLTDEWVVVGTI